MLQLGMLAEFLFGPVRAKLLSALLLQPELSLHARELARRADAPPASTNRELAKLAETGILLRQQAGNQIQYRANRDCPIFAELANVLRKTSGIAAILTDALGPLAERIESALIFGSVARGEETTYSDVDVLVLGEVRFAEVLEALYPVHDQVRREINPVVYRTDDFCTKLASGNTWAREVVDKPKLFLIGTQDEFTKLVEDR